MQVLIAIFKLLLGSVILFGYYWFFLRNRQHHVFNRIYLLGLVVFSLVMPFIHIPTPWHAVAAVDYYMIQPLHITISADEGHAEFMQVGRAEDVMNYPAIFRLMYLGGVLVSACCFLFSLRQLFRLKRSAEVKTMFGTTVYYIDHPAAPFTFLGLVFWQKNEHPGNRVFDQMFAHEYMHLRQKHSLDLLFLELVKIFYWFNPVFYLVKKELSNIHEFIADAHAAGDGNMTDYAELLLTQAISNKRNKVTNHFFDQPIKRRILMLSKKQDPKNSRVSRYFALPFAAILFFGFVLYANTKSSLTVPENDRTIVVSIDPGHGGADPGASGANGMLEKDINLAIAKKIEALASAYHVKVVLTRTTDVLPGNTNDVYASLRERSALSNKTNAALLVSIHMGAMATKGHEGLSIYIPKQAEAKADMSACISAGTMMVTALQKIYPTNTALLQREQSIWMLNNSTIPAMLIECGYLSNPKDSAFVSDPANQEKLARSILEGIVAFAANQPK
jgi:N-acetylmuramoyl-L-alanine amidase